MLQTSLLGSLAAAGGAKYANCTYCEKRQAAWLRHLIGIDEPRDNTGYAIKIPAVGIKRSSEAWVHSAL
jgi:hypothetical protein